MKMVKKFGLLASVLLLTAGMAQAATTTIPPIKVAVVNMQEILQQSPKVVNLSKKLEGQFKNRQAKIAEQQKVLQDEMEKLKKEAPTMSKQDRDAMEKKVASERSELVKQVVAYQQDLQKEQNKIMQGISNDLNGIVSTIAKQQNFALVLEAQSVIFASESHDITKDVASKFNSKG